MNIRTDLRLSADQYFQEKFKKDLIVLHHTVGGPAKSTFDYWGSDAEHIGTAYIVERDGTIYEVFPPECWAYHLGLKIGPMGVVDKRSIGIEIASEGPLLERDGKFYAFGRMSEQTEFKGEVFEAAGPWRGYSHFAQYTPEAIAAVSELVDSLLTRFNVPRQTPADHTSFDLNGLRDYSGVLTHCQLRADKSDCHPGFDWNKLIVDCKLTTTAKVNIKAQAFAPLAPSAVGTNVTEPSRVSLRASAP